MTREDYEASEDDNQLVTGVSRRRRAGSDTSASPTTRPPRTSSTWSAWTPATDCVKPSKESIQDGSYKPLSRPLFMYPSAKSVTRPEVKAFLDFTVANAAMIAEAAKIVPLTEEQAAKAKTELARDRGHLIG